jgi:hypothetical protein
MILFDSTSTIVESNQESKPFVEVYLTRRKIQQSHQHPGNNLVGTIERPPPTSFCIAIVTIMFLTRCCYGDFSGPLNLKNSHRNLSVISSQLKCRILQTPCREAVASELLRSRQNPYSKSNELTRTYGTLYEKNSPAKHTMTFIASPSLYHHYQQQSFASTKTKPPRAANRWRSPILRPPVVTPGSKRPPKLFKRLHNIRGKKNSDEDDDTVSTILDDGKLYRADRVLANRTGKSRKECFQLLKERRVFMVTDQLYNKVSTKKVKDRAGNKSALLLNHSSNSTDILSHNGDAATPNNDSNDEDNQDSKNIVQQYRLEVITGPAIKIGMHTKLRIDKYQDVPLPPPLLMIYHKPKVRNDSIMKPRCHLNVNLRSSIIFLS